MFCRHSAVTFRRPIVPGHWQWPIVYHWVRERKNSSRDQIILLFTSASGSVMCNLCRRVCSRAGPRSSQGDTSLTLFKNERLQRFKYKIYDKQFDHGCFIFIFCLYYFQGENLLKSVRIKEVLLITSITEEAQKKKRRLSSMWFVFRRGYVDKLQTNKRK